MSDLGKGNDEKGMPEGQAKTTETPEWESYAAKAHEWIQEAYARVYNAQAEMTAEQTKVGLAASYCLLASHDYLEIAFFGFHKKLYHPGMACLRPVAEMAITFLWCTFAVEDYVDRLGRWAKDPFDKARKTYQRLEEWVLRETDKEAFAARKAEWDNEYERHFADLEGRLPSVLERLKQIDQRRGGGVSFQGLYPMLYAVLCASSHGVLVPDRYFVPADSAIDRRAHAPMPPEAPWAALTAAVYLVVGVYQFFGWDYSGFLKQYRQLLGMPE